MGTTCGCADNRCAKTMMSQVGRCQPQFVVVVTLCLMCVAIADISPVPEVEDTVPEGPIPHLSKDKVAPELVAMQLPFDTVQQADREMAIRWWEHIGLKLKEQRVEKVETKRVTKEMNEKHHHAVKEITKKKDEVPKGGEKEKKAKAERVGKEITQKEKAHSKTTEAVFL